MIGWEYRDMTLDEAIEWCDHMKKAMVLQHASSENIAAFDRIKELLEDQHHDRILH